MTKAEKRSVAKIMRLMSEAVDLAWKRDAAASIKVYQAIAEATLIQEV